MCIICNNNYDPNDLTYLDCSDCLVITMLPENLPNLKYLVISNSNITTIPSYPQLSGLYCLNTNIEYLPDLPQLKKLIGFINWLHL